MGRCSRYGCNSASKGLQTMDFLKTAFAQTVTRAEIGLLFATAVFASGAGLLLLL
jgi:hypothetical protein